MSIVDIPNAILIDNVLSGGQPNQNQYVEFAEVGYKTIVDLRPFEEMGGDENKEMTEEAGLAYVNIPVAGEDDLTGEVVEAFAKALQEYESPMVVHCQSGNRVGALYALKAGYLDGATVNEAMKTGVERGLTKLTERVRMLLMANGRKCDRPMEAFDGVAPTAKSDERENKK